MFGVLCYFLLVFLPRDVISQYPQLEPFVGFMSNLVPGIAAFSDNVSQESVRFVYALSWAMLPFWLPVYPWSLKRQQYNPADGLSRLRKQLDPHFLNRLIVLFSPLLSILMMWVCWTGYPFSDGPPDILAPISFTSIFSTALLMFIFSQVFLLGFWLSVIGFFIYPTFIRYAFSRSET